MDKRRKPRKSRVGKAAQANTPAQNEPPLRVYVTEDVRGVLSGIQTVEAVRRGPILSYEMAVLEVDGTQNSRMKQLHKIIDVMKKISKHRGEEYEGFQIVVGNDDILDIIGTAAKNLKLIMRETQTVIRISHPVIVDIHRCIRERLIMVTGTTENVVKALHMISDILAQRNNPKLQAMGQQGASPVRSSSSPQKEPTVEIQGFQECQGLLSLPEYMKRHPPSHFLSPSPCEKESFQAEAESVLHKVISRGFNNNSSTSADNYSKAQHSQEEGANQEEESSRNLLIFDRHPFMEQEMLRFRELEIDESPNSEEDNSEVKHPEENHP